MSGKDTGVSQLVLTHFQIRFEKRVLNLVMSSLLCDS